MATIVEELIGLVGLEIDEGSFRRGANALENIGRQYERVAQSARNLALAGAGVLAFTAITNKMTAEQARMAEAVGISTTALNALGGVAKSGGLEIDVVVDLIEELNNKLGESKGLEELTAVTEATKILGLEFKTLKDLAPEEQFIRVLEAAQELEDQQAAVSAADILLGGDANKFIGLLRTQDKSVRQLIEDYERLNLLTEEGTKEAKKFTATFAGTVKIFKTATQQIAALLGRAIEPMLKAFNNWIASNKVLTQSIISLFVDLIPLAFGISGVAVAAMTIKLLLMAAAWAFNTIPIVLLIIALSALGVLWVLVLRDISRFIQTGDKLTSVTGRMVKVMMDFGQSISDGIGEAVVFVINQIDTLIDKIKLLSKFANDAFGLDGGGIFDFLFGGDDELKRLQGLRTGSAPFTGSKVIAAPTSSQSQAGGSPLVSAVLTSSQSQAGGSPLVSAVPIVSQSQAGGLGPLRSAGSTTTNSNQTSNSFNLSGVFDAAALEALVARLNAQAVRANSTGITQ